MPSTSTYSAAQIVGKNLIAARPVKLTRSPSAQAPEIYTAQAGQSVGVVFSWVGGGDKGPLWWQFLDSNKRPYYALHEQGAFSLEVLQAQGTLTVEEERKAAEEKKKQDSGAFPNPFGDAAGDLSSIAKNVLVIGGVVLGGALLLNITQK